MTQYAGNDDAGNVVVLVLSGTHELRKTLPSPVCPQAVDSRFNGAREERVDRVSAVSEQLYVLVVNLRTLSTSVDGPGHVIGSQSGKTVAESYEIFTQFLDETFVVVERPWIACQGSDISGSGDIEHQHGATGLERLLQPRQVLVNTGRTAIPYRDGNRQHSINMAGATEQYTVFEETLL